MTAAAALNLASYYVSHGQPTPHAIYLRPGEMPEVRLHGAADTSAWCSLLCVPEPVWHPVRGVSGCAYPMWRGEWPCGEFSGPVRLTAVRWDRGVAS